ncbi:hypothetical protein V494_04852 [Pseudogymnoascus sp. VKM F-4513 (FW-928)]|nr:hypothetical protein V494_04852 [Pseudogymnoascus sp. VKM F-4513 (FW-928)]
MEEEQGEEGTPYLIDAGKSASGRTLTKLKYTAAQLNTSKGFALYMDQHRSASAQPCAGRWPSEEPITGFPQRKDTHSPYATVGSHAQSKAG